MIVSLQASRRHSSKIFAVMLVMIITGMSVWLSLRPASYVNDVLCLHEVTLGLLGHQTATGTLPAGVDSHSIDGAVVRHSWRAAILNRFAEPDCVYDFDCEWSSDRNARARLCAAMIYAGIYVSTSPHDHERSTTNVIALSGDDTALSVGGRLGGHEDSLPADIIVVVSGSNLPIQPLEPADPNIADLAKWRGTMGEYLGIENAFAVLFGDGTIWVLSQQTPASVFVRFGTVEGAKAYDREVILRPWLIREMRGPLPSARN